MSRWQPDARGRLEQAALELYSEQGFAATTVPQIAARAGLTTRTYFRHFADKRESLFGYDSQLPATIDRVISEAPTGLSTIDVIDHALASVASVELADTHSYQRARRSIIESDEGLRERELRKLSMMSSAARGAFERRGLGALSATIAGHVSMAAFTVAVDHWLDQHDEGTLPAFMHDAVVAIGAVADVQQSHASWPRHEQL